jgi:hypothetical protein
MYFKSVNFEIQYPLNILIKTKVLKLWKGGVLEGGGVMPLFQPQVLDYLDVPQLFLYLVWW